MSHSSSGGITSNLVAIATIFDALTSLCRKLAHGSHDPKWCHLIGSQHAKTHVTSWEHPVIQFSTGRSQA